MCEVGHSPLSSADVKSGALCVFLLNVFALMVWTGTTLYFYLFSLYVNYLLLASDSITCQKVGDIHRIYAHLSLFKNLRMSGAIPPFPLCAFMACIGTALPFLSYLPKYKMTLHIILLF